MISLYSITDKQLLSYDYWEELWTHIPDSRREDANLSKKTAQFPLIPSVSRITLELPLVKG